MYELLASLVLASSLFAKLPAPEAPPQVELIPTKQLQELACESKTSCADLYFFTAPDTGVIYVSEDVNLNLGFAQAELFREVSRYLLTVNGVYSPYNPCSRNVKIESALEDMELDFIKVLVKQGQWNGYGVPTSKDLPDHIFFCQPDKEVEYTHI